MIIEVRNIKGELILLNTNHIIRVKPHKIKNYKIGEDDPLCTKIESIGAMVSSTLVYDSVEEISKLIKTKEV